MENFRFGMTKVYSEIPPPPWKTSIWDTRNTPPWKTSDLRWPKFTRNTPHGKLQIWDDQSEIPPPHGKLQIWDDQSEIPPHGKLQIWDDQSLLRNTPPPHHPPPMENFRFGMTKVYSEIPPLPPMENFRFGMRSEIPPSPPWKLQIWDDQSLLRNTPPYQKLSESSSLRFSEYRELLHVETLSNPDNFSFRFWGRKCSELPFSQWNWLRATAQELIYCWKGWIGSKSWNYNE